SDRVNIGQDILCPGIGGPPDFDGNPFRNCAECVFITYVVANEDGKRGMWQNSLENPFDCVAFMPINLRFDLENHLAFAATERVPAGDRAKSDVANPIVQVLVYPAEMHAQC